MNKRNLTLLGLIVALFTITTVVDGYAQRRPVTTHSKCEDKIISKVDKTPWKLTAIGYLTSTNTPVDTADIVASAGIVSAALGGDFSNEAVIVDSLKGWMGTTSWTIYFQFTRTVSIMIKEWKCIDDVMVLVRDIDRTFDEKTAWKSVGPFTGAYLNVKKFRTIVMKQIATLPAEYEGPME